MEMTPDLEMEIVSMNIFVEGKIREWFPADQIESLGPDALDVLIKLGTAFYAEGVIEGRERFQAAMQEQVAVLFNSILDRGKDE